MRFFRNGVSKGTQLLGERERKHPCQGVLLSWVSLFGFRALETEFSRSQDPL